MVFLPASRSSSAVTVTSTVQSRLRRPPCHLICEPRGNQSDSWIHSYAFGQSTVNDRWSLNQQVKARTASWYFASLSEKREKISIARHLHERVQRKSKCSAHDEEEKSSTLFAPSRADDSTRSFSTWTANLSSLRVDWVKTRNFSLWGCTVVISINAVQCPSSLDKWCPHEPTPSSESQLESLGWKVKKSNDKRRRRRRVQGGLTDYLTLSLSRWMLLLFMLNSCTVVNLTDDAAVDAFYFSRPAVCIFSLSLSLLLCCVNDTLISLSSIMFSRKWTARYRARRGCSRRDKCTWNVKSEKRRIPCILKEIESLVSSCKLNTWEMNVEWKKCSRAAVWRYKESSAMTEKHFIPLYASVCAPPGNLVQKWWMHLILLLVSRLHLNVAHENKNK